MNKNWVTGWDYPSEGKANVMKYQLNIYKHYIALVFCILILFSGCNPRSDELNTLLENPVSTTQFTTGHEVSRWHEDKGVTLGMPVQAKVRIEYVPVNNYTQEDLYNEMIDALDKNNWEKEEQSIVQTGYFRATLPQNGFSLVAEVLIDSQSNIVSIQLETNPN